MKKETKLLLLITIVGITLLTILHINSKAVIRTELDVVTVGKGDYHTPVPTIRTEKIVKNKKKSKFIPIKECTWSKRIQKVIWKICQKEHFSFETCIAQAKLESSWNSRAIGDDGQAWGAWQIHPSVWHEVIEKLGYRKEDMFNLEKACKVYVYIMISHFKRWDNVNFALLAWRWGGDKAMNMIDNNEYSSYSNTIISLSQKYERRFKKYGNNGQ